MGWLARALLGPLIWAALFCAVYALHGVGCAQGWSARPVPLIGDLQRLVLVTLWLAGLAVHLAQITLTAVPQGVTGRVVSAGGRIGLVSSLVTQMPVIATSTCLGQL